jgi:hypothetical protein
MKWFCDIDGLTDNWVEVSERWTRRDSRRVRAWSFENDDEFWELFARKVEKLHLVNDIGAVVDDPANMDDDFLLDCDDRLAGFVGNILVQTVDRLAALGNVAARLSSNGTDPTR